MPEYDFKFKIFTLTKLSENNSFKYYMKNIMIKYFLFNYFSKSIKNWVIKWK
jgi:hypothetical protein